MALSVQGGPASPGTFVGATVEGRDGSRGPATAALSPAQGNAGRAAPGEFAALVAAAGNLGRVDAAPASDSLALASRAHNLAADLPWDALADAATLASQMLAPLAAMAMGLGGAPISASAETVAADPQAPAERAPPAGQAPIGAPSVVAANLAPPQAASLDIAAAGLGPSNGPGREARVLSASRLEASATTSAAVMAAASSPTGAVRPLAAGEGAPAMATTPEPAIESAATSGLMPAEAQGQLDALSRQAPSAAIATRPAAGEGAPAMATTPERATESAATNGLMPAEVQDQLDALARQAPPAAIATSVAAVNSDLASTGVARRLALPIAAGGTAKAARGDAAFAAAAADAEAAPGLAATASRQSAAPDPLGGLISATASADLEAARRGQAASPRPPAMPVEAPAALSGEAAAPTSRNLPLGLAEAVDALVPGTEPAVDRADTADRRPVLEPAGASLAVAAPAERMPGPAATPTPAPIQPGANPAIPPRVAVEAGHQVALRMARAVADGVDTISVDLRPPELGRVEVRMTFRDGTVQVVMAAERADTFEAFRQDRTQLEQQLAQAGIDLGGGGLDLRHGGLSRDQTAEAAKTVSRDSSGPAETTAEVTAAAESRRPATDSLIDIIA